MSWRTVVVSSHCKLDLKMGCMVIRSDDTKRVSLDEVSIDTRREHRRIYNRLPYQRTDQAQNTSGVLR